MFLIVLQRRGGEPGSEGWASACKTNGFWCSTIVLLHNKFILKDAQLSNTFTTLLICELWRLFVKFLVI